LTNPKRILGVTPKVEEQCSKLKQLKSFKGQFHKQHYSNDTGTGVINRPRGSRGRLAHVQCALDITLNDVKSNAKTSDKSAHKATEKQSDALHNSCVCSVAVSDMARISSLGCARHVHISAPQRPHLRYFLGWCSDSSSVC